MTDVKSAPTRRTVLKGAAWSVPAIAVAATVPMAAASGEPVVIGGFHESSGHLHHLGASGSTMWVDCIGATNSNEYVGLDFVVTVTITYSGGTEFSLENAALSVTDGVWSSTSSARTMLLTSTQKFVGCGGGQYLKGWNVLFHAGAAQPDLNTIQITGSAVSTDGRYKIDGLINDVQPGGAGPWVGPTSVTGS